MMNERQEQRFKHMCDMHDNGKSIMEIAAHYGITKQRVSKIFREQGMPLRVDVTDEELLTARDPKAIAERYSFKELSVKARMKRLGVTFPKQPYTRSKFTDACIELIIADYNSGMKQVELAEKYNTWQGYISNLLRKNGIKRFTRGVKS